MLATCGCFYKLVVFLVGVLVIRALLFGVHIGALDFASSHVHVASFRFSTSMTLDSGAEACIDPELLRTAIMTEGLLCEAFTSHLMPGYCPKAFKHPGESPGALLEYP